MSQNESDRNDPPNFRDLPCTIRFLTDTNAEVSMEVPSGLVYKTLRHFGAAGWTSGDVPPGGFKFPLELEENFDWSIIGARRFETNNGDVLVEYKGEIYKRRVFEEQKPTNKNPKGQPPAVKYSRGVKNYDDHDAPHIEHDGGDFKYIALAVFRGGGANAKRHLTIPRDRRNGG